MNFLKDMSNKLYEMVTTHPRTMLMVVFFVTLGLLGLWALKGMFGG